MYYDDAVRLEDFFHQGMDRDIPKFIPDIKGELKLNMGSGNKAINDSVSLDLPKYDFDIFGNIPYDDNVVHQIYAYHFLEHLKDPIRMLLEFQRVLIIGGHVNIVVPYYSAQIACQDLDHKKFFSEETWKTLFQNPYYNKNKIEWEFKIGFNMIMGIVERNLCLFTQLIKY